MTKMTAAEVRDAAHTRHYAPKILGNAERGDIAEEIVAGILDPGWQYCGGAWAGWDFQHSDGTRIELKQSAARQTYTPKKASKPIFSIKKKAGYWKDGTVWKRAPIRTRFAHIYIFAWHGCVSDATCDQADPAQWQFYMVPTTQLPCKSTTVKLDTIQKMVRVYNADELPAAVEAARCTETVRCDVAHRWPCCP